MKMTILIAGLAPIIVFAATTHAEDETEGADKTTTDTYRSPWANENETDPFATPTPVWSPRRPVSVCLGAISGCASGSLRLRPQVSFTFPLFTRHSSQRPSAGLTDRYGMPQDIPSKVIKTDRLGRQQVYRTDRYGMAIGDPIDEQIIE